MGSFYKVTKIKMKKILYWLTIIFYIIIGFLFLGVLFKTMLIGLGAKNIDVFYFGKDYYNSFFQTINYFKFSLTSYLLLGIVFIQFILLLTYLYLQFSFIKNRFQRFIKSFLYLIYVYIFGLIKFLVLLPYILVKNFRNSMINLFIFLSVGFLFFYLKLNIFTIISALYSVFIFYKIPKQLKKLDFKDIFLLKVVNLENIKTNLNEVFKLTNILGLFYIIWYLVVVFTVMIYLDLWVVYKQNFFINVSYSDFIFLTIIFSFFGLFLLSVFSKKTIKAFISFLVILLVYIIFLGYKYYDFKYPYKRLFSHYNTNLNEITNSIDHGIAVVPEKDGNKMMIECNSINYCFTKHNVFYNLSLNKEKEQFEEKKKFINSKNNFNYWDFYKINKDLSFFHSVNLNYYKLDVYKKIIPFSYVIFLTANINYINGIIVDKNDIMKNKYNFYISKINSKHKSSIFIGAIYRYALLIKDEKNINKIEKYYSDMSKRIKKEYKNKLTDGLIRGKIKVFDDKGELLKYGDDYSMEIVRYRRGHKDKLYVANHSRYVIEKVGKNGEFSIENVIYPNIFLLRLVVNEKYKNIKVIKGNMGPFKLSVENPIKDLGNIEIKLSNKNKIIKKIRPKKGYYYVVNMENGYIIPISKKTEGILCLTKGKCGFIKFYGYLMILDLIKKEFYINGSNEVYFNPKTGEIYGKKWKKLPIHPKNYREKKIIKTILRYFTFK